MKTKFFNLAIALAMAGGSIALSSCDDDDNKSEYSYDGIDAFVNMSTESIFRVIL